MTYSPIVDVLLKMDGFRYWNPNSNRPGCFYCWPRQGYDFDLTVVYVSGESSINYYALVCSAHLQEYLSAGWMMYE